MTGFTKVLCYSGDRAPLASDNNAAGFGVGAVWIYNDSAWLFTSETDGNAEWKLIT